MQIGDNETEWMRIRKRVRQSLKLSPDMFLLYGQRVMDELMDLEGVKNGGQNVNNIRYEGDTVVISDYEEKLKRTVESIHSACVARSLHINLGKRKAEVTGISK